MRKHGWQLPYHPLQIVAIAVFSALAFSFYVFFVPFLGSSVLKLHIIATFSPLVVGVTLLYIRCAAVNPADAGIQRAKLKVAAARKLESSAEILLRSTQRIGNGSVPSDGEQIRSPTNLAALHSVSQQTAGKLYRALCCAFVVLGSWIPGAALLLSLCSRDKPELEKYVPEEQLLYCSLCEAEILKTSKHCRACDKCVDGFDHHCRWLNNCIARKNYKSFVAVMVFCLLLLVLQWSIGIYVLVRCFSKKGKFDEEIAEKLGSSFSRLPYIVVVTICTSLALVATLPLLQLLLFHILLIRKGISTYDYILAIREQEQHEVRDGHLVRSLSSSPASSIATAMSGASSLGALQRAVWCTPPRMFVEHQGKADIGMVVQYSTNGQGPPFRLPSVPDVENAGASSKSHKPPVGISPWKLARLSTKEASKAAVRARENSLLVRPVRNMDGQALTETEESSFESSAEISTASGHKVGWKYDNSWETSHNQPGSRHERDINSLYNFARTVDAKRGRLSQQVEQSNGQVIAPLQLEAKSPFRSKSFVQLTTLSSGAGSTIQSPDLLGSPDVTVMGTELYPNASHGRSWLHRASDGYEASGGESADDTSDYGQRLSQAWSKLKMNPSYINKNEIQSTTTKWGSRPEDTTPSYRSMGYKADGNASSACDNRSSESRVEANILKHVKKDWPGIRDRVSTSSDGSFNSSPTQFELPSSQWFSPDRHSSVDFTSRSDKPAQDLTNMFYDRDLPGESLKVASGKKTLSSARRLKDSILAYKRGLSRAETTLLSSSP